MRIIYYNNILGAENDAQNAQNAPDSIGATAQGRPYRDGRHVISYRVTEAENSVQNVKNSLDGVLAYSEGAFLA